MPSTPAPSAADFLPARLSLSALRQAAAGCTGCALYRDATQTVFGEGPRQAHVLLIGEQPGDKEDLEGKPFVGPAGALLTRAVEAAGIARNDVYITNAVKHFKWEPRGKRRIHKKPQQAEVRACRPWLEAEVRVVQPAVVVCMGVTAASAAFGHAVRLKNLRGRFSPTPLASQTFVTVHPSAILRIADDGQRRDAFAHLVEDFTCVRERVTRLAAASPGR